MERLQRAGEVRVAASGRKFSNHYDLAAHLLNAAGPIIKGSDTIAETALGRVDLLFDFLNRLNLATPDSINPYVGALHDDLERRPLAEQIIDQLLAEDESRYKIYEEVRANRPVPGGYGIHIPQDTLESEGHEAIGNFLTKWIAFERTIRNLRRKTGELPAAVPTIHVLRNLSYLNDNLRREIDQIRRLRNELVHGIETPPALDLNQSASRLEEITRLLEKQQAAASVR